MNTTTAVRSSKDRASVTARLRPRWKWTTTGLATGALLVLVAMFQDTSGHVVLGFMGFTLGAATLLIFLAMGPAQPKSFRILINRARGEDGAALAEWGLLVVLIAIVALVAVQVGGNEVSGTYSEIASTLDVVGT